MKYLVNRETKEHLEYLGIVPSENWDIVEADSEGWIPWDSETHECPLPDGAKVEVKFLRGKRKEQTASNQPAEAWVWDDPALNAYRPILTEQSEPEEKDPMQKAMESFIKAINDCAKSIDAWGKNMERKSKRVDWSSEILDFPETVSHNGETLTRIDETIFADVTVFDRLRTAIEHADSIPAIIAEINGLLPEGYQVIRTSSMGGSALCKCRMNYNQPNVAGGMC